MLSVESWDVYGTRYRPLHSAPAGPAATLAHMEKEVVSCPWLPHYFWTWCMCWMQAHPTIGPWPIRASGPQLQTSF